MTLEVDDTAVIHRDAELGDDVSVGAFTVVGANVRLGPGSRVESHCVLGAGNADPLRIGAGATIRSHSVLYGGSRFGAGLETGHHVTTREGLHVGRNLRLGTNCDLQGHATIGNFVRLHSGIQVNHGTTLEDFVWIFPYVVLTNDPHPPSDGATMGPTIRRGAAIGARSLILPGVVIGEGALVAAGSTVTTDVERHRVVRGIPARDVGATSSVTWRSGEDGSPYPWWTHFQRGYPDGIRWTEDGPVYDEPEPEILM